MAEAIDIRELNMRIEQQSGFVQNLVTGMDQVIVGQKHLVDSLLMAIYCWRVFLDWLRRWLSRRWHS